MVVHNWSYWKKRAKKQFQLYVRLRDADKAGCCRCITCGRIYHYKRMNGGHFIPAEWTSTCFMEINCHSQCVYCNLGLEGNREKYREFMIKKYGLENVEGLEKQKHIQTKYTIYDFQIIEKIYKDKCNEYLLS